MGALFIEGLTAGALAIWFGGGQFVKGYTFVNFLVIVLMICAGIGLGSTWVVQRVMILKLSPPDKTGEFVGFSYISGRLNAAIAFFVWGLILDLTHPFFEGRGEGYKAYTICIVFLLAMLFIGLGIVYFVKIPKDEERKKWAKEFLENGMKTQTEKEKESLLALQKDNSTET